MIKDKQRVNDPRWTTVTVQKSTREELKHLGAKGESYDAIILRLLEDAKTE